VTHDAPISGYFLDRSLPDAHGRNVVNVILVDFRALDTLGEISVLGLAGIGVYALLKLRPGREVPRR
jgi:multicomponent Na+:H+ antiporter subunit A